MNKRRLKHARRKQTLLTRHALAAGSETGTPQKAPLRLTPGEERALETEARRRLAALRKSSG